MLPRNPPPENFGQLLDVFRMSRHVHRLIELNLVVGANFALGWIRKCTQGLIIVPCLWVCLQGVRRYKFIWTPCFNRGGGLLVGYFKRMLPFSQISLLEPAPCGPCRPNGVVMYNCHVYSWWTREFLCSDVFVRNLCSMRYFICSCVCHTFTV
jgi:hypothetical protein